LSSASIEARSSPVSDEVEEVEVLGDPRGVRRLGDDLAALLDVPAQHDLRGRPGVAAYRCP
jgi:hypothetical protein